MLPIYITEIEIGLLSIAVLFLWRWAGGKR